MYLIYFIFIVKIIVKINSITIRLFQFSLKTLKLSKLAIRHQIIIYSKHRIRL